MSAEFSGGPKRDHRRSLFWIMLIASVLIPVLLVSYKLLWRDYPLADLVPQVSYRVDLTLAIDGHGGDFAVSTYLPVSDGRQVISAESYSQGPFTMSLRPEGGNRLATWKTQELSGHHEIRYSFDAVPHHVRYVIPPQLPIPENYPELFQEDLAPAEGIQVGDPLILEALDRILPSKTLGVGETLELIHRYLQDHLENRDFAGFTDALTALKLEEASCNGKSRLFVAMARSLNIPARLVGGLILTRGTKRVSHQWVEAYVNGYWVPFDTINDHFAEIPGNFLTLYYGDQVLFRHDTGVNFRYLYQVQRRLVPRAEVQAAVKGDPFNVLNLYSTFERVGISQNLLKIILMLPLGVFVVSVLRNVIGLETFGTFLPALIAASARESGFWWGMGGFVAIILVSSLIRKILDRVHLLHTPKMAIMFTMVILLLLGMTVLAVHWGLLALAHITLFPIAILAITAERFALMETEQGFPSALKTLLTTVLAVGACFAAMDSLFLQSLILVFPEFLLLLVALNLWLGKWIGIRFSEFVRFRHLLREPSA